MKKRFDRRYVRIGTMLLFFFLIIVGVMGTDMEVEAATAVSEGNTFLAADGNTYTYTLYDNDKACITKCDVANPVIVVPEIVDGYEVAGFGISTHTSKLIPNGITEIESIYINSPYIQNYGFASSTLHIGTVTIGEDVANFGLSIFSGNTIDVFNYNATSGYYGGTGAPIGASGLQTNPTTKIGHLNIGDNVQKIPSNMFCNISLDQDVLEIHAATVGSYAFESHGIHFGTFTLTDDVKSCGYFVTSYCDIDVFNYNITDMTYTMSLNSMFGGGSGGTTTTHIGRLNIGDNVKSIPQMAFEYIELDQDELVLDVTSIGDAAFRGKDIHIGHLVIGENMTKMGYAITAGTTIGVLDYNAVSSRGSSAYGVFGPTGSDGTLTTADTVNIAAGVRYIPQMCFENMNIGTVNYNAVDAVNGGSSSFGIFRKSTLGQINIGSDVTAIPAGLLLDATAGNSSIVIPASVTTIGSKWATDVTMDNLESLYVYANTKASSPSYTGLDYPNLYIHRGSGFYDYFTNTNDGEFHDGMTVHLFCDDHMGDVEYEDNNGVSRGFRHRNCLECGYEFEGEYLLVLECGEGVASVSGQNYYEPGTSVAVGCEMQEPYSFEKWVDVSTGETVSSEKNLSYVMTSMARNLRAEGSISGVEFTVRFNDPNGYTLKEETVRYGEDATPPEDPELFGCDFTGWNGDYTNVTEDRVLTAQFTPWTYTVVFEDWDGTVLKTEVVEYGEAATPPEDPEREGYVFDGWDGEYRVILEDTVITAAYLGTISDGGEPEPEPEPDPEPVPGDEPIVEPEPDPQPEPGDDPVIDPEPGQEPGDEPVIDPESEPGAVDPEPGTGDDTGEEPVVNPVSEPENEPAVVPENGTTPGTDDSGKPEPSDGVKPKPVEPDQPDVTPTDDTEEEKPSHGDAEDSVKKPEKSHDKKQNKDDRDIGTPIAAPSQSTGNRDSNDQVNDSHIDTKKPGGDDGAKDQYKPEKARSSDDEPKVEVKEEGTKDEKMSDDDDKDDIEEIGSPNDGDMDDTVDDGSMEEWKVFLILFFILFFVMNLLLFILFCLFGRRIKGEVFGEDGEPVEGIVLKLFEGNEVVQETVTDKRGRYVFRDISREELVLKAFDGKRQLLSIRIVPKEKDVDYVFAILMRSVAKVEADRARRTYFVDIYR